MHSIAGKGGPEIPPAIFMRSAARGTLVMVSYPSFSGSLILNEAFTISRLLMFDFL